MESKESVGIDVTKDLVTEAFKIVKAALDGFQTDDVSVYVQGIMKAAQQYNAAGAELKDLTGEEGFLLTEHSLATIRLSLFTK
jgi:hypothetical protein